jgi:RNA polymerase sigma-70 factor (ECF subfamily)
MHANPVVTEMDNADGLSAFLRARPRLFGIAYRMLGSAAEAEDIVQDVWIRWQTTDRRPIRNPLAFLVTATARLAINMLQSARARREIDAGPGLPEPVDTSTDPGVRTERREALKPAIGLLLEKLSPPERAAYVLREAFNHSYREIAGILRVEEANARQLVTRAREHVSGGRRATANPAEHRCLLDTFVTAARTGDLTKLENLFAVTTNPRVRSMARRSGTLQIRTDLQSRLEERICKSSIDTLADACGRHARGSARPNANSPATAAG